MENGEIFISKLYVTQSEFCNDNWLEKPE